MKIDVHLVSEVQGNEETENLISTYVNNYTIVFTDLKEIALSNKLLCTISLENIIQEGSELMLFNTYYVLDGKSQYNI